MPGTLAGIKQPLRFPRWKSAGELSFAGVIVPVARLAAFLVCLAMLGPFAQAQEPLFRLQWHGDWLEGTPLYAKRDEVLMLLKDGRVQGIDPADAKNYSELKSSFHGLSAAELRGELLSEFGKGFEVSAAGHYLVVHPSGSGHIWAPRFEELYRSFVVYFSSRGFKLQEPRFPLVAVVYATQADFNRQLQREQFIPPGSILGYYSPKTNRITMFDVTAGKANADWTVNADTIIHEATHQTAFNVGIHNRFSSTPQWIAEGLGTMFEAKGVWNSRANSSQATRINRGRMEAFKQYSSSKRDKNAIADIVADDRIFQVDPNAAYSEAWALTFFLSETEPKKYQQYLAKVAAVPRFTEYSKAARLQDFVSVFGTNLSMLDARMQRFVRDLK